MSAATTPLAPKPAHVPDELVIDWDFTQPPGGIEDLNAAWKTLHDGPDIVWTPRNGGHWIATQAEDIEYIQRNHDPFSMRRIVLPDDIVRPASCRSRWIRRSTPVTAPSSTSSSSRARSRSCRTKPAGSPSSLSRVSSSAGIATSSTNFQ